jgi:hypothetical protein
MTKLQAARTVSEIKERGFLHEEKRGGNFTCNYMVTGEKGELSAIIAFIKRRARLIERALWLLRLAGAESVGRSVGRSITM